MYGSWTENVWESVFEKLFNNNDNKKCGKILIKLISCLDTSWENKRTIIIENE